MTRRFLLLLPLLSLAGCAQPMPAQTTVKTSNPDAAPELLFQHDGVRVFRFRDSGRTVYYTAPPSITTESQEESDANGNSYEVRNQTFSW